MRYTQHHKRPAIPKSRLIIGRKPMIEALDSGRAIEKIFILQSAGGEEINLIKKKAKVQNIALSLVPAEKLERFTAANHQGVIAIAGLIAYQSLQDVISMVVDRGETPLIIVLDGITDTRNLGAIARAAHCYGAHALVTPVSNSAAVTEEAVKTSAGALETLHVCRVASVEEAFDILKLNGIATVATLLQTDTMVHQVDLALPTALILGAEDKGVSNFVRKHADHLVRIPMAGNFDSLNVAVATGIILYEAHRQRTHNFNS